MSHVTAGRPEPRFNVAAARGEEAFRSAARQSRVVRGLKIVLPAVAILAAAVFGSYAIYAKVSSVGFSLAGIDLQSNQLIMNAPSVSGFEGTKQSYELKAARAIQSLDNPTIVRLEEIGAKIGIGGPDAQSATIAATTGIYDSKAETLLLTEGIKVNTSNGYSAALTEANIDLKNGRLSSTQPVELRSEKGMISANGFEISENGRHILFTRGVRMTIEASAIEEGMSEGGGTIQ